MAILRKVLVIKFELKLWKQEHFAIVLAVKVDCKIAITKVVIALTHLYEHTLSVI